MGKPGTGNAVSSRAEYIGAGKASEGTETSQYLEERKSTETPRVVASERGPAQTGDVQACRRCVAGVVGRASRELHLPAGVTKSVVSRRSVEHRRHSG
jgi:hypothetical protein